MSRRITHSEIAGRDGAALESFYGDLFGCGNSVGWIEPKPAETGSSGDDA